MTIGMKIWMRIGLWNVRTMMEASRLSQVIKEMTEYRLDLLGLSEIMWRKSGDFITSTGELLIYSGRINEEKHEYGVGLILSMEGSLRENNYCEIKYTLAKAHYCPVLCPHQRCIHRGERSIL
jgi:hypothetical protein